LLKVALNIINQTIHCYLDSVLASKKQTKTNESFLLV